MNYETSVQADAGDYSSDKLAGMEESRRTSKRPLVIGLGLLALIAAIAVAYFLVTGGETAAGAGDDRENQAAAISVIAPGKTSIEGEIATNGTLAARRVPLYI